MLRLPGIDLLIGLREACNREAENLICIISHRDRFLVFCDFKICSLDDKRRWRSQKRFCYVRLPPKQCQNFRGNWVIDEVTSRSICLSCFCSCLLAILFKAAWNSKPAPAPRWWKATLCANFACKKTKLWLRTSSMTKRDVNMKINFSSLSLHLRSRHVWWWTNQYFNSALADSLVFVFKLYWFVCLARIVINLEWACANNCRFHVESVFITSISANLLFKSSCFDGHLKIWAENLWEAFRRFAFNGIFLRAHKALKSFFFFS